MKTVLRNGSVAKVVEYEARGINADGDACDVAHFETAEAAIAVSKSMVGVDVGNGVKLVAWVVEKHTSYHPAHLAPRDKDPDNYERIAWGGSGVALAAGGWIEEDEEGPKE